MATEPLARAFAMTRELLADVGESDYARPTPCASWTVRDLANHIVEGANWFALCVNAGKAPQDDPTHGVDYAADDLMARYDEGVSATVAAFGAPGAMERMIELPFGTMPGAMFMGMAMNDVFTHGWDLASALGRSRDLDPEMASMLLGQLQGAIGDEFRGPDGVAPFGPKVDAADDASAADRLAAFLGRRPLSAMSG
jgi:uncharacterized protein (TIGR03086 family)